MPFMSMEAISQIVLGFCGRTGIEVIHGTLWSHSNPAYTLGLLYAPYFYFVCHTLVFIL